MNDAWRQRLADEMAKAGISPAELTRIAGVGPTMVHDILKRGVVPSIANLSKLASALGLRLIDLLSEGNKIPDRLKATGVLSGGDMWTDVLASPAQDVSLDFFQSDLIAVEIQTNDLQPTYRVGDVVAGPKSVGAHLDNLIGRDCIICTADSLRYIRTLHRGSLPRMFTLRPIDRSQSDIANARILWAAPIRMIIRP